MESMKTFQNGLKFRPLSASNGPARRETARVCSVLPPDVEPRHDADAGTRLRRRNGDVERDMKGSRPNRHAGGHDQPGPERRDVRTYAELGAGLRAEAGQPVQ